MAEKYTKERTRYEALTLRLTFEVNNLVDQE